MTANVQTRLDRTAPPVKMGARPDAGRVERNSSVPVPSLTWLKTAAVSLPQTLRRMRGDDPILSALPPGADAELARLMRVDPAPLILPKASLIVIFSAKSACSSVVIWFLNQLGHLKAARDYHVWPHQYRAEVYYNSRLYATAFRRDFSKMRVVRVVRDPFSRAVSSYRHALGFGYADTLIGRTLRRRDIKENGFSFAEFLDVLERIDLTQCDMHFRIQRHPLEDRLPVRHLINVSTEDLFTRLNEVEADLRLPHTDFAAMAWLQQLNEGRIARGSIDDLNNVDTRRFTARAAIEGPWAPYDAFLTPAARARIARLYAVDIAAYGSAERPSAAAANAP